MDNEFLSKAEQLKEDAIKTALNLKIYETAEEIVNHTRLTDYDFIPDINSYVIRHGNIKIYYPNLGYKEIQIDIKFKNVVVFQACKNSQDKIDVFTFRNGNWAKQLLEVRDKILEKEILDKFGPVAAQPLVKSFLWNCWDKFKSICSKIFGTINGVLDDLANLFFFIFRHWDD